MAESVKVTLDLKNYVSSKLRIVDEDTEAEIEIPIARLNSVTVNVPVSNIAIENVPEGMRAVITEIGNEVQVQVNGLEQNLVNLDPLLITGTVDVSSLPPPEGETGLVPNVYEIPVNFIYPSGIYPGDTPVTVAILLQLNDNAEDGAEDAAAPADVQTDNTEE